MAEEHRGDARLTSGNGSPLLTTLGDASPLTVSVEEGFDIDEEGRVVSCCEPPFLG